MYVSTYSPRENDKIQPHLLIIKAGQISLIWRAYAITGFTNTFELMALIYDI